MQTTSFVFETFRQKSDVGYIYNHLGKFKVYKVKKYRNLYFHIGILLKGYFFNYQHVNIYIDKFFRYKISINHSVLHLLILSLKRVLTIKIQKIIFCINEHKLTFDFNYYKNISSYKLFVIEQLINLGIIKPKRIFIKKFIYKKKHVNLVFIGNDSCFSIDLCNCTHIKSTNNIAFFCIVSDKSVAKGIRRIEAFTNKDALHYNFKNKLIFHHISSFFNLNIQHLETFITNLKNKQTIFFDFIKVLKKLYIKQIITSVLNQLFYFFDYKVLINTIHFYLQPDIFLIITKLVNKLFTKSIIILYVFHNNSINVFLKISKDCFKSFPFRVFFKNLFKQNHKIYTHNDIYYIKNSLITCSLFTTKKVKTNIKIILIK